MIRHLRTYRFLHAALALALLLNAALPMVRYACEMMGETADISVLAVTEHEDGAMMPACKRHGVSERQRDACPERACTVQAKGQSPALTSPAPRLPAPDRLFAAALLAMQEEQAFAEEARPLVVAGGSDETQPERVPVRLRTSTYLL